MSGYGITVTLLATQLAEAVRKDEAPEEGGFDLSAGLFGKHVSDWIRTIAKELDDRAIASNQSTIFAAKYNPCVYESSFGVLSLHRTGEGANKAIEKKRAAEEKIYGSPLPDWKKFEVQPMPILD